MGNRANIVLVDRDGWQLRYSHWGGCRMLDALLAGPKMARRYITAQQEGEFWTDELWADGGLMLDLAERKLVFFGEEIMTTMNERRAMFEVLSVLWSGYTISWAYDATSEIAGYVGVDAPLRDSPSQPELIPADDTGRLHHLVTIAGTGGDFRAWPLWWGSSAAWHGPQLLERLPGAGAPILTLGKLPESGVHVDVPNRTVGVWLTNPVPGLFRWLPQLWPGWRIERWDDRYEEHLLRCGQRITAPELDIASGVANARKWLRKRVFQRYADSPGGHLKNVAVLLGAEEPEENEQWIFAASEQPKPAEWARFERACSQVVARLAA